MWLSKCLCYNNVIAKRPQSTTTRAIGNNHEKYTEIKQTSATSIIIIIIVHIKRKEKKAFKVQDISKSRYRTPPQPPHNAANRTYIFSFSFYVIITTFNCTIK